MDATRLLGPIERQRVGLEFRAPECGFETLGEPICLRLEPAGGLRMAQAMRPSGSRLLRGKDVALDLRERDVTFGQSAVGMKNRIVGILPTLICETAFGRTPIFDKTVLIRIAAAVDPVQRGFYVR